MENQYELMVLLAPDLGEKQQEVELEEIRNSITSNKGKITYEDIWGIKDLAYVIKKHEQGFYAVFNFELEDGRALAEMKESYNLNQAMLRYLILKIPKNYEVKTLEEYEKEAAIEEAEREKEKEEKREAPRKAAVTKKASIKKVIKEPVKKKESTIEKTEKEKKEKAAKKLDEVDEKLKNIINDPDINL